MIYETVLRTHELNRRDMMMHFKPMQMASSESDLDKYLLHRQTKCIGIEHMKFSYNINI